ncbi:hypothetical protein OROMI_007962 [Orobanche minor]
MSRVFRQEWVEHGLPKVVLYQKQQFQKGSRGAETSDSPSNGSSLSQRLFLSISSHESAGSHKPSNVSPKRSSRPKPREDEKDVKVFNKNFKKYVQRPLALRKLSCKLEWGEGNEGQITLDLRTKEGTCSFGSGRWATYALHIGLSTRDV